MGGALRLVIGREDAGDRYEEALTSDVQTDPRVSCAVDVGVPSGDTEVLTAGRRAVGPELTRRLLRERLTHRCDSTSTPTQDVEETTRRESRTPA